MPSKKKKYNARFPPGRIKKIMQTDEDVGKVAQAVPIMISRTLELFVSSLLCKTVQITNSRQAKTLSSAHLKQCIFSESRFDFLRELVANVPDASANPDEDNHIHSTLQTPTTPDSSVSPLASLAPLTIIAPDTSSLISSTQDSSCAKFTQNLNKNCSRRRSSDKGDKSKYQSESVAGNESVFSYGIPKLNSSVSTTFNASRPNFYTEVNINSSDKPSKSDLVSQTMSSFSRAATLDEDYDT